MAQVPYNPWNGVPGQPPVGQPVGGQPPVGQPVGQPPYGYPVYGPPGSSAPAGIPSQPVPTAIPVGIPLVTPVPLDDTAQPKDATAPVDMPDTTSPEAPAPDPSSRIDGRPASSTSEAHAEATTSDEMKPPNEADRFQWSDAEVGSDGGFDTPSPQYVAPVIQIQQPRKTHGWIVAIVVILCLFGLTLFGMYRCSALMSTNNAKSLLPSNNTVAIIDIDGTIQYDGTSNSPEGLSKLLTYAEDEDSIKAVVLRVNSGGGVATAGEEMAALVHDFSKPIVVSSASLNASAAYEISSQADYIFVSKTSEIGSIGTALEMIDYSGLMELLGIDVDVITSSDSKDSSYGYRPLTDEERAYYQSMVDQINEVFIENVAAGRNMPIVEVKSLATGLVYTGIDAVQNGLADEIGTRDDAIAYAAELADLQSYETFNLGFSKNSLSLLEYLL